MYAKGVLVPLVRAPRAGARARGDQAMPHASKAVGLIARAWIGRQHSHSQAREGERVAARADARAVGEHLPEVAERRCRRGQRWVKAGRVLGKLNWQPQFTAQLQLS
jgi:hypothetical protein